MLMSQIFLSEEKGPKKKCLEAVKKDFFIHTVVMFQLSKDCQLYAAL
jgi:hypothetical protein